MGVPLFWDIEPGESCLYHPRSNVILCCVRCRCRIVTEEKMKSLLSKWTLGKKIAFLGVLSLVMFAVPAVLYIQSVNAVIEHKRLEVAGVEPASLLLQVVRQVQQHRGLSNMVLSG